MNLYQYSLSEKKISFVEFFLILITSVVPLFLTHPYRINLFLAWEGAFRMMNGEIPYRDFGSPVGYGFWILPALFFRIFGPYVYTLLVFQSVVNVVSGLVFRSFLKLFGVSPGVRFLALLVYCLSYSMFNFWPWYNHLVFVIELAGLYLLCHQLLKVPSQRRVVATLAGGFLIAWSFMTKQDTGALAFLIAIALLLFDAMFEKHLRTFLIFLGGYGASLCLLILPFLQYEFTYWFNFGQFPHNARVNMFDVINEFLGASDNIKLYLLLFVIVFWIRLRHDSNWRKDKRFILFAMATLAVLAQAAIIQVTSYTPVDGNIYFHSFAFAFLAFHFTRNLDMQKVLPLATLAALVCLWWSGVFWTRFLKQKVESVLAESKTEGQDVISRKTYLISTDTMRYNRSNWIVPGIRSFKRIRIPENTAEGVYQLMSLPEAQKPDLKMLNMSELTSLAYDMGYSLEKGASHPLWFHKGVSFFDREVDHYCGKIASQEYDIILFEDIPNVNQFYPYEVRDCIREKYVMRFRFLAPRIPEISYIEVYTKE
jgi:hypothetical protein